LALKAFEFGESFPKPGDIGPGRLSKATYKSRRSIWIKQFDLSCEEWSES
jgi:hypothetical protein